MRGNSTTALAGFNSSEVYHVRSCLYSCSSLKVLTLRSCNLEFCGNAQWNQLECLKIITTDVINQMLSGTPQLKVFYLSYVDKGGNLSIQSTSLKELYIQKFILAREDFLVVSELRICTPNLETLEIKGVPYKKYSLTDVSSLTRAVFGLLLFCHIMLTRFSNPLSQILPSVQHAENVTLSDCCTKVVDAMKMKCTRSAFPNVKSLELKCCYKQVVVTLEIFPQLERLVIENTSKMTPSRSSLRQFSLMSSPSSSVEDN
ncbi:uncharacterized protein LOC121747570 isoform X1 [Salvia splendens]|uniref:uncharacterized protein LOC121747570 isoform X1 n=1 Tax=Salvia splendens TaxID=180675 RepID=UPI0010FFE215|nr:uncharacterized protein LOC121747570 isoform X1 [Salvia splendens]